MLKDKNLKPRKFRGRYNNGATNVEIATENEDVGDYIDLDTDSDTDASDLYGNSNAECYVVKKKRRRRFFGGLTLKHRVTLQAIKRHRHHHNHGRRRPFSV